MSEIQTRKLVLELLVEQLNEGHAYYINGIQDEEVENLIFPCGKNYGEHWKTVNHFGFWIFKGETPNGGFTFSGGGGLTKPVLPDGDYLAFSEIVVDEPEVLEDLKYPFELVIRALQVEIAAL